MEPAVSAAMTTRRRALTGALLAATLSAVLAACGSAGGPGTSPSTPPSARPTPTPITVPASTKEAAAALVVASNPLFTGTTEYDPDMIGASRWWKATALPDGGWSIELMIGWGDCPAGCIERHVWVYEVTPVGAVTLKSESGDEVPANLPA